MRIVVKLIAVLLVAGVVALAWGRSNARTDPVVRRATIAVPGWPAGAPPMRVAVLGDIHIGNATMDPARLTRIVRQVNSLRPDLVLLAGDFIAGHAPGSAAAAAPALVAPLSGLRARQGVAAVLGNHDWWTGAAAVRAALARARVTVIDNDARRYGTLTIVGIGDISTRHDDVAAAMAAARRMGRPRLIVSHGPDIVPKLPGDAPLAVVSHTHCGQIVLPLHGPIEIPSRYGDRYLCGIVREPGRATIVGAGLGTSIVPLRYGAPPDIWLLTLTSGGTVSRPRP